MDNLERDTTNTHGLVFCDSNDLLLSQIRSIAIDYSSKLEESWLAKFNNAKFLAIL